MRLREVSVPRCLSLLLTACIVIGAVAPVATTAASAQDEVVEWKYSTNNPLPSASITVADGTVYFVGGNKTGRDISLYNSTVSVYAFDAGTGTEKWRFNVGRVSEGRGPSRNYISVYKGAVYVHGSNGVTYAIDAKTGHEIWSVELTDSHGFTTTVANGTVYIGASDGLYARDVETGEEEWNRTTNNWRPIVVSGDTVYAGDDKKFYALNSSTGEEKWNFTLSPLHVSISSDTVYIKDKRLYALNTKTGKKKWEFDRGNRSRRIFYDVIGRKSLC